MGDAHRVGIIGLGVISQAYLETLARTDLVVVTAVADLDPQRAATVAAQLESASAMTVEELLASEAVDTVLNLTIPAAHAEIAIAAMEHGKNAFSEKPLATTVEDGRRVISVARERGVKIGCAPDTVLGTGTQTAREVIDDGVIGRPIAATATMITPGHERWHPNPDFYYRAGGGPLFDMGPYYLSSLVHLLGPVRSVVAMTSRSRDIRTILTGDRAGTDIPVEINTHYGAVLEHESGVLTTLTMSFDGVASTAPPIEIHGEKATLQVPDPNGFGGAVRIRPLDSTDWVEAPPSAGYADGGRGVGLLDFIEASDNTTVRASGSLALHVVSIIAAISEASESGLRTIVEDPTATPPAVAGLIDLPTRG